MTVQEVATALGLEVIAGADNLETEITGGYAADLLSCVMAKAQPGNVWITLQAHPNVIAVANLRELACVIITEGTRPDEETRTRANEQHVPLLLSNDDTYTTVGKLVQLNIR